MIVYQTPAAHHSVVIMDADDFRIEDILGPPGQEIALALPNRQVIGKVTRVFTVLGQIRWVEVSTEPRFVERIRWADVESVALSATAG